MLLPTSKKKPLCPYDCWHIHVMTHVVEVGRPCLSVLISHLETKSLVPAAHTRCSFHVHLQVTKRKRSDPIVLTKGNFRPVVGNSCRQLSFQNSELLELDRQLNSEEQRLHLQGTQVSVPSTNMAAHNPVPGELMPSFGLWGCQACTWYTYIHKVKHSYTKKCSNKSF